MTALVSHGLTVLQLLTLAWIHRSSTENIDIPSPFPYHHFSTQLLAKPTIENPSCPHTTTRSRKARNERCAFEATFNTHAAALNGMRSHAPGGTGADSILGCSRGELLIGHVPIVGRWGGIEGRFGRAEGR